MLGAQSSTKKLPLTNNNHMHPIFKPHYSYEEYQELATVQWWRLFFVCSAAAFFGCLAALFAFYFAINL